MFDNTVILLDDIFNIIQNSQIRHHFKIKCSDLCLKILRKRFMSGDRRSMINIISTKMYETKVLQNKFIIYKLELYKLQVIY